jgi:hypothetical protein
MEETAAAAAAETVTETAPVAATEQKSSYRYWVREATGDAAPLPVPRKLDAAAAAAANGTGNGNAPQALGSVWNQVSLHSDSRLCVESCRRFY